MLKKKLLKFLFHPVFVTKFSYFTYSEILAYGVTVTELNSNSFSGHLQYRELSKILLSCILLLTLKLFT